MEERNWIWEFNRRLEERERDHRDMFGDNDD